MKRYQMICSNCRGERVFRDACAEWNEDAQQWELTTVYDHATCEDCDSDTNILSEEIPA